MKNNKKGFTLIEVIISLAIISIALVSFVSLFGQSLLITDRGSEITQETFDHQEFMENEIVKIKKEFLDGDNTNVKNIEIFKELSHYQSNVDVKVITEDIRGNRKFLTLVSNVEIPTQALPDVTLNVGAYPAADASNEVFPWYDDNIVIRADYTLNGDPIIFNNRIRWYQSQEEVYNPSFPSEYDIIHEEEEEEPFLNNPEEILLATDNTLDYYSIPNRFYNFELRAYTLAGRLGYFMNEDRILILPREGTPEWQAFIEDIYLKTSNVSSIIFDNLGNGVYAEVMQNPERPTLNVDWVENVDPEGAQVAISVPTDVSRTIVKFKVDSEALAKKLSIHGFGFLLGDDTNSGLAINFDISNNSINLREVLEASYEGNILGSIDLLTDVAFEEFRSTIDGDVVFNWNQEYNLEISHLNDDLTLRLEYEDEDSNLIQSDSVILSNLGTGYNYFGFKSFSSLDYIPQERYEILNKYNRNYSIHFYDVVFESDEMIPDGINYALEDLFVDMILHLDSTLGVEINSENNVTSWLDLSGNDNDFESNISQRPWYNENFGIGLPLVNFDANNDQFLTLGQNNLESNGSNSVDFFTDTDTEFSLFMLAQAANRNPHQTFISKSGGWGGSATYSFGLRDNNNFQQVIRGANGNDENISNGNNEPNVHNTQWDGENHKYWVNGEERLGHNTIGTSGNQTDQDIVLGAAKSGQSRYLEGDIGEVIVFEKALTDEERAVITTYLKDRWFGTKVWEFYNSNHGWAPAGLGVEGFILNPEGYIEANVSADPYIHSPNNLNIDLTNNKTIKIRMRNNTDFDTAQIYFVTTDGGWSENYRKNFSIVPNSDFLEYTIDMSDSNGYAGEATWEGTLEQFRVDPIASVSGTDLGSIAIDYIRVLE